MAGLLIDGTPRDLRLDFRALQDAERLMSRSVLEVLGQHGALFKLDELAALCWAAWRRDDKRLTYQAVQTTLRTFIQSSGSLIALQSAVSDALMESGLLQTPDAEDEGRPPMAEATTAMAAQPREPSPS